ncbi:MAG: segregation/condensation protein A [Actinobacteria bacterium]|nr:MAG: segregation/condensation protein A [Actinomycetota bacterium]
MAYKVSVDAFEGPFDLLLHLVARQRLDVADISMTEVIDQYLAYVDRMKELDLEVASDFLLVAAMLLEIKAARLLPEERAELDEELEDLGPEEARELLVERLLAYKRFKNAAGELSARHEAEARMHPRAAGLEEPFLGLLPDFLEGVTLRSLALICAELESRRDLFLLEAEHVAARPISLEEHVDVVAMRLSREGRVTFAELLVSGASPEEIVVTFLAILELYKRGAAELRQESAFGDIEVVAIDGEAA